MNPDDASRMTIGDLEVLAARLEAAATTIRNALALLGAPQVGLTQAATPAVQQPALHPVMRTGRLVVEHAEGAAQNARLEPAFDGTYRAPQQPVSPVLMTPEREEYMREIRGDPQRAALLAQFRKDGPAQEESVRTEMLEAFGGGT